MTAPDDPSGQTAPESLWDEACVERWRQAYAEHPDQPGLWDKEHLSRGISRASVRGHSAYVFQDRMNRQSVERSYQQMVERYPQLSSALLEDGHFGAVTYQVGDQAVSRDLLDSIAEIGYLSEHFELNRGGGLLDIGAGYGRLAHRLNESFPAVRVGCTDSIAESSALCETYLRHRNVSADVLGRFDVAHYLSSQRIRLATAIHCPPEMSLPAIEEWLILLEEGGVEYLFLVPNEIGDLRASDEVDDARLSFEHSLRERGYDQLCRKLKYDGRGDFVYQDEFILYATESGKERALAYAANKPAHQQTCQACGLAAIPLATNDVWRVSREA